ncbi:MAG: GTPase, partial [Gemmatimonadales bacterium]
TRELELGPGLRTRITDTVGFIRKLPHHLVASFRATLEEAREADVLLHVVDASHPEWEEHVQVVEQVLSELEMADQPALLVFNKSDRLADPASFEARVVELYPGSVVVNTIDPHGLDRLRDSLAERARGLRPTVRLLVSPTDGKRLAEVYRAGEVVSREDTPEGMVLTVRMDEWKARQFAE